MDFDFTDDQVALREGARELLDDLAAPARVRAHTGSAVTRPRAAERGTVSALNGSSSPSPSSAACQLANASPNATSCR